MVRPDQDGGPALDALERHRCRPSSARPSRSAAPAAASRYTKAEFIEIVERSIDASQPTKSDRGKRARLEGIRDGGRRATARIIASSSARSRTSIRWACIPAIHHRRAGADADRQRNTRSCATPRSRCCARSASRPAAPTCSSPSIRPTDACRHRDEPARVAFLGARVEGHRLPDRKGRRASSPSATRSTRSPTTYRRRDARPRSSRPSITWSPRSRASPSRNSRRRRRLTTSMKSVGEVMAIGRTFQGSLQGVALARDGPHRPRRDRDRGAWRDDDKNAMRAALWRAGRRIASCRWRQALRLAADEEENGRRLQDRSVVHRADPRRSSMKAKMRPHGLAA